jgi:hypothetical protein
VVRWRLTGDHPNFADEPSGSRGQASGIKTRRSSQSPAATVVRRLTPEQQRVREEADERLVSDHAGDEEFLALRRAVPITYWQGLPSLASHRNGRIDQDVRALGLGVAAAVVTYHELEHARLYRRRGPPADAAEALVEEILVTAKELHYLLLYFTQEEQDAYLTYLRKTSSIVPRTSRIRPAA